MRLTFELLNILNVEDIMQNRLSNVKEEGIGCLTDEPLIVFVIQNRDVFASDQGTLNKALRRIIRDCNLEVLDKVHRDNAANLTNFSNHSLRNTFTTGMCEVGVNTKAVQEIFEHAHAETTMKIYAEATKDLRKSELINF